MRGYTQQGKVAETAIGRFDTLGLPTAMAIKGKGNEGDNLVGFDDTLVNPAPADLAAFFNSTAYDEATARKWLGNSTTRHVYYFGETLYTDGSVSWGTHPSCACGIVRETHVSQLTGQPAAKHTPEENADHAADG